MPSLLGTRQHWAALGRELGELLACPCPCVASGSAEDSGAQFSVIILGWRWLAAATPRAAAQQRVDASWLLCLHHPIC